MINEKTIKLKRLIKIALLILLTISLYRNGECRQNQKYTVKLDVNVENEVNLQKSANDGHQPWRMNPVDVAHSAISSSNNNDKYDDCHIIRETANEAWVKCTSPKEIYVVYLKRLVEPNGIWTAISIEISQVKKQ